MNNLENDEITINIIMVGDSSVGKSCILQSYCNEKYNNCIAMTIGLDYRIKRWRTHERNIKLLCWDTAGQERFRALTNNYYKKCDGIMLVFDLSNKITFQNITKWLDEIYWIISENDFRRRIILIGNKCDIDKEVSKEEIDSLIKKIRIPYIETSAKIGFNIEDGFQKLIDIILSTKFNITVASHDYIENENSQDKISICMNNTISQIGKSQKKFPVKEKQNKNCC